jgi:uncharacterized repeat protein (TIGR01451 family)
MKRLLISLISLTLPALAWANISNTAFGSFKDLTGASYSVNSNTVVVTVITPPVITLSKNVAPAIAKSGNTVIYTIQYQNTGGSDANNVTITDVVPAGSTLVAGSISGGGTFAAGTITWALGTVTAGAAPQTVTFKVTVN